MDPTLLVKRGRGRLGRQQHDRARRFGDPVGAAGRPRGRAGHASAAYNAAHALAGGGAVDGAGGGPADLTRALVLFAVMASCRTLAVAGQEMLTPYLYVFGPTSLALYVNFAQTLAFLLHYAASCHRHRWLAPTR